MQAQDKRLKEEQEEEKKRQEGIERRRMASLEEDLAGPEDYDAF